jgi:UDP-3-O-acyl-N-acetylglucosamine deacetylase
LDQGVEALKTIPVDWDRMAEGGQVAVPRMQTTLARPVEVSGRGTFFGKSIRTLRLCPTDMDGWWFERTDLPDSLPVRCSIRNVWTTGNVVSNIVLRSGSPHNYIRMAEHMIALRMGLGIDNLLIKIESGDPPLFNRGSADLVQALRGAGVRPVNRPVKYVTVRERVTVANGCGGFLTLAPADPARPLLAIDAAVDFATAIGKQRIRFAVDPEKFAYGATARTNTSAAKMLYCKTIGLLFADIRNLGYSFENLLVAGRLGYWNQALLPHNGKSLEAVWHRATLDLLAAIALIEEGLFVGEIISYKSGHGLDVEMVQRLYQESLLTPLAV